MLTPVPSVFWSHSMTVYTPTVGSGGAYTTAVSGTKACRLDMPRISSTTTMADRAEALGRRRLYWQLTYTMPAEAQVVIGSDRWQIERGTITSPAPLGAALFWACDVTLVTS